MITLRTDLLELRGVEHKTSSKGNNYYILFVENSDGRPYNFYVPSSNALEQGLKKGDFVNVTFELSYYKGQERLNVCKVEKAV